MLDARVGCTVIAAQTTTDLPSYLIPFQIRLSTSIQDDRLYRIVEIELFGYCIKFTPLGVEVQ